MTLIAAAVMALIAHAWLPPDPRARAGRLTGRMPVPVDARLIAAWRARSRNRPGQEQTGLLLLHLISELAAGGVPESAFGEVLGVRDPSALREACPTADVEIWSDVSHVWAAAEDVGFSLAGALQRIHASALIDQEVAREVRANAAAPRFGLITMALMPIGAWMIGALMGAQPVTFLFTTIPGLACLVLGIGCIALAALWMHRMAKAALA